MRDLKPCAFAAFLICMLSATHLTSQQFDPRERFEVPDRVRLSENVLWSLMKNQVLPSYPAEAQIKGIQGEVALMLYVDRDGRVSNVEEQPRTTYQTTFCEMPLPQTFPLGAIARKTLPCVT